ncbi:OmpA family protein [Spirosoma taeanense]|uniref:OmpA family protein n=1 Tax=Spirosoma taeanense TaxID=2735870 RepID=A0A6M5YE87_9BACT|nr:OmpA family protein [Spirosoma taeanense]QJW91621.1 OmpA family protein [Spirosoma taeanense]
MSRLWMWWAFLSVWVTGAVLVHLFYIKRIRLSAERILPHVNIIDGKQLRLRLPGGLFHQSQSSLRPLGNRSALDTLAGYLKRNPRRLLVVTGYHTPAESQQTLVTNLGLVRAHAVRDYLLNTGVPDDQVKTWGKPSEVLTFIRDSTNALSFAFQSIVINAEWLARHQKYINLFHPLQLYFPTGSTEFIHTPDNERFTHEAVVFLRAHPKERLRITGHTDSVGTVAGNLRLSRARAMAVRDQLMPQGLPSRRFTLVAMGDKNPIAPNALPEGREANRRVTLVIDRRSYVRFKSVSPRRR